MAIDNDQRLYVQLRPTPYSLEHLVALQSTFMQSGRLVNPAKIHLTIIHFGIVSEVLDSLPGDTRSKTESFANYVSSTQEIIEKMPEAFTLKPKTLELFGDHNTTLVVTYEPTEKLLRFHELCLQSLKVFLDRSGVENVEEWMINDRNFTHARTIRPHITLVKNYSGLSHIQNAGLEEVTLTKMPLLY